MDFASVLESFGNTAVLSSGGFLVGALFGYFAQRSRFCLRAAVIEFWHRRFGEKLSVWLLAVASAWWFSHAVSANSFEPVQVQGPTFSGPSAEWLLRVLSSPAPPIGFDFGLLPGVFIGSFIGAWMGRDLRLEGFSDGDGMRRHIAGAVLMGFGSMLAGGCAVGAGMTGGAVFALTAWITLVGMWIGAGVTDRLLDRPATAGTPVQDNRPVLANLNRREAAPRLIPNGVQSVRFVRAEPVEATRPFDKLRANGSYS